MIKLTKERLSFRKRTIIYLVLMGTGLGFLTAAMFYEHVTFLAIGAVLFIFGLAAIED